MRDYLQEHEQLKGSCIAKKPGGRCSEAASLGLSELAGTSTGHSLFFMDAFPRYVIVRRGLVGLLSFFFPGLVARVSFLSPQASFLLLRGKLSVERKWSQNTHPLPPTLTFFLPFFGDGPGA